MLLLASAHTDSLLYYANKRLLFMVARRVARHVNRLVARRVNRLVARCVNRLVARWVNRLVVMTTVLIPVVEDLHVNDNVLLFNAFVLKCILTSKQKC